MAMRSLVLLISLSGLFLFLCTVALFGWRTIRRRRSASLEGLLGRLAPLDRRSVALIAADLQGPTDTTPVEDLLFDPSQIWELIGGMDGLARLEANCAVLIDLAALLQRRYPEALMVAEELRLQAREIQWHLERLRGAARLGKVDSVFEDYAQRAIGCYYGMTQRVLALYAYGDGAAHARLAEVF